MYQLHQNIMQGHHLEEELEWSRDDPQKFMIVNIFSCKLYL